MTIRLSNVRRVRSVAIAALAAGTLALAGCSGGGETSEAGESGEVAEATEAPAEEEATTYTEDQLKAAIAELDVNGTTFSDLPMDSASSAQAMEGLEIEPAECQELIAGAANNETLADLTKAGGISGDSASTVVAIGDATPEALQEFADSRETAKNDCSEFTVSMAGQETSGSTESADVTVEGSDTAEGSVSTITAAGTEMQSVTVVASAGSVLVTTTVTNSDDVQAAADIAAATLEGIAAQG